MHLTQESALRRSTVALLANLLFATAAGAEVWQAQDVKTSIALRRGPAASLGLRIENVDQAIPSFPQPVYSASRGKDVAFASLGPLGLGAEIEHGRLFTRLAGGAVIHRGGFDLAYPGGKMPLHGFVLASSAAPRTFELRTAAGELAFTGDLAHFELDRKTGRLVVFNVDLQIGKDLAARLGDAELAGTAIGVLALEARLVVPGASRAATIAGDPCADWSGNQDVALINIPGLSQGERDSGLVSVTPSAFLKNVGTANVPWFNKFSGNHPPYNNAQHPFLVWSLYRVANGRIEQLAVSDVKHAFLTINSNCDPGSCTDDHILGLGCEDVYGQANNEEDNNMSFRSEVTAHSGLWQQQGSHFDQDNNNVQDHPPANPDPEPFRHNMVVNEADLATAGATYYVEAWYVVRDDVDIFNSMGWRKVTPSFNGSIWTFGLSGSVFQQGSALAAWVDPNSPGSGNSTAGLDTGVGHLRLAAKTTNLGNGTWRYDYALVNHDLDRQVASFSIPLGGASASAAYFRDLDADAGNNWQVAITSGAITWTKVAGPGLDWGVAYNFGFVSDQPPTTADATLVPAEAGSPASYQLPAKAPTAAALVFADGFESGGVSAWH